MITLAVLAVLFVLAWLAVCILGVGGLAAWILFADIFVATAVIYFIVKLIKRKKS